MSFKSLLIIILLSTVNMACTVTESHRARNASDTYTAMSSVAKSARESGELLMAANIYMGLTQKNPDDIRPLLSLADTLVELGEYEEAINYYYQALTLDADNLTAKLGLSKAFLYLDEIEDTINQLQIVFEQAPKNAVALNLLGTLLDFLQWHEQAQHCYKAGLRKNANDPQLNNNMGLSLAIMGQYEEALAYLAKASQYRETLTQSRANMAAINTMIKKLQDKNIKAQEAAELHLAFQQQLLPEIDTYGLDLSELPVLLEYCTH